MNAGRWEHLLPAAIIALVGGIVAAPALDTPPFGFDNMFSLSLAATGDPVEYFTSPSASFQPGWRPLAYTLIWAQRELVGAGNYASYFVVNGVLWILCGLVLYALVHRLTGSRAAALAAGLLLAVDFRALEGLYWIIERQTPLACVLGGAALWLVAGGAARRPLVLGGAVFLLLLAAALSKEAGLAFSVAVVVAALLRRPAWWRAMAVGAGLAVGVYALLRLVLVQGSVPFCEDVALLTREREVCYAEIPTGELVVQGLWNATAALGATIFPVLFTSQGALREPQGAEILSAGVSLLIAAVAAVGVVRRPRSALPLVALLVAVAATNAVVYRPRNVVTGAFGFYGAVGVGAACLQMELHRVRRLRAVLVGAAAFLALLVLVRALLLVRDVDAYGRASRAEDPCAVVRAYPRDVDESIARELQREYGLPREACGDAG